MAKLVGRCLLLASLYCVWACSSDDLLPEFTDFDSLECVGVSWNSNISSIVSSSCALTHCHTPAADYTVYLVGSCGSAEIGCHSNFSENLGHVPGKRLPNFLNSDTVRIYANEIRKRTSNGTMPPYGRLPQAQIDQIACWVDGGAEID